MTLPKCHSGRHDRRGTERFIHLDRSDAPMPANRRSCSVDGAKAPALCGVSFGAERLLLLLLSPSSWALPETRRIALFRHHRRVPEVERVIFALDVEVIDGRDVV